MILFDLSPSSFSPGPPHCTLSTPQLSRGKPIGLRGCWSLPLPRVGGPITKAQGGNRDPGVLTGKAAPTETKPKAHRRGGGHLWNLHFEREDFGQGKHEPCKAAREVSSSDVKSEWAAPGGLTPGLHKPPSPTARSVEENNPPRQRNVPVAGTFQTRGVAGPTVSITGPV